MGENEYFEYYDYETKKFQILTIFTNSNIKQKDIVMFSSSDSPRRNEKK